MIKLGYNWTTFEDGKRTVITSFADIKRNTARGNFLGAARGLDALFISAKKAEAASPITVTYLMETMPFDYEDIASMDVRGFPRAEKAQAGAIVEAVLRAGDAAGASRGLQYYTGDPLYEPRQFRVAAGVVAFMKFASIAKRENSQRLVQGRMRRMERGKGLLRNR